MTTWREFSVQQPEMAEEGRRLLYQFGVGLGFLATIRPNTGPRLHPMCPIVHDDRLLTRTTGHGDFDPQHTVWKASPATP